MLNLTLLLFLKWDQDSNMLQTLSLIFMLIIVNIFNLLLCEPATRMSNHFDKFDEELHQCDWYLLPIELRRMYMVFLSETQNSIQITSYGGITCERETTKKVFAFYGNIFKIHSIYIRL